MGLLKNTFLPEDLRYATFPTPHHKTLPRNHTSSTQNHPDLLAVVKVLVGRGTGIRREHLHAKGKVIGIFNPYHPIVGGIGLKGNPYVA